MSDSLYEDDYYQSPEAKMMQKQLAAEERRHQADTGIIEDFLRTLNPADALADLFTFVEMYTWGLKHWKKRPKEGA